MTGQPDPCGASCEPAEDATAEARSQKVTSGDVDCSRCGAMLHRYRGLTLCQECEDATPVYTGDEPWWDAGNA